MLIPIVITVNTLAEVPLTRLSVVYGGSGGTVDSGPSLSSAEQKGGL